MGTATAGKIQIYISSDWEGMHLDQYNINSMKNFNKRFPNIGITHFLNAAYFTKKNASSHLIKRKIDQTIKATDSFGLHIHGWSSLFKYSEVKYKNSISWEPGHVCSLESSNDCGHDIPIFVYKTSELRKVIRASLILLKNNGYYPIRSFRAGGWMAKRNVLEAIYKEGIYIDSSAVDARLLSKKLPQNREFKFLEFLLPIWPNTNWSSQPEVLSLYDNKNYKIKEYPNNGLFADYLTGEEMFRIYREFTKKLQAKPSKDFIISYGFHQETADRYLHRIESLIRKIKTHAKSHKIQVEFLTL